MTLGLLSVGGAALATRYLFQEPASLTWSRYLLPELRSQRKNYPSLGWAFDVAERLIARSDPREVFFLSTAASSLDGPASWDNSIVGPRPEMSATAPSATSETILVTSSRELTAAIKAATPGTVIELQPGEYHISGRSIPVTQPGQFQRPIVVRAPALGRVRLHFDLLEGFHVSAPYWIFENLVIEGACKSDGRCEHAFHVVGAGANAVIRNNWVSDFNAAVKVNGRNGNFPDNGLIEHNAFVNSRPRDTHNPVSLLDIVAVNGWQVRKNVIADFAKAAGDHISYGAFFKGAGEGNVFEQNLVRCEWRHGGGTRIGISFGGGGTSKGNCRDGRCDVEHYNGIARNNIIMNCPNDVGIYLNKSAGTRLQNNALVNTRGIDVRFPASDARIVNNVIDGRVLARDGGRVSRSDNILSAVQAILLQNVSDDIYAAPQLGDFRLKDLEDILDRGIPLERGGHDLCDQPYGEGAPDIGPIQYGIHLPCTPLFR